MESQTADLTANRIEARNHDGLRGIINYDLNAGSGLECTNVTTLTPDDTALHLVVVNMEHADRVLDSSLSGHTLDGLDDNLLGLCISIELGLVHDLIDIAGSSRLGLILHRLYQTSFCLLSTET